MLTIKHDEEAEAYIDLFEDVKRERDRWVDMWEDVGDYLLPRRSMWDAAASTAQDGKTVGEHIYDGYPVAALQLMADGMQGYLVGQAVKWFKLKMVDEKAMALPGVADWLEHCEKVMYAIFERSNFYGAVGEFFIDGGGLGTAYMLTEEDIAKRKIYFDTRHPKEMYIVEGDRGEIDMIYREYYMSAITAQHRYGDDLPEDIIDSAKNEPMKPYPFLHCVHKRGFAPEGVRGNTKMPWASVHMLKETANVVERSGYNENPYLTWRWRKNSDEMYGRSPGSDSLNEIKKCHQISKGMMKHGQLVTEPPLMVPSTLKGKERIVPFGYNYYTDPSKQIFPMRIADKYPVGKDVLDGVHKTIDEHFYTQFFLMLARAERQMTAREIIERQGEKSAVLSAVIGRLNNEFLYPLVNRVWNIAERARWFRKIPAALLQSIFKVDVEFQGPLAQAMRRFQQSQGLQAGLGQIMTLAGVWPEILDNFDPDVIAREVSQGEGMPQNTVRETPEVEKIRKAKAQAAQQQQQLNQMDQVAGIMEKTNEAAQPGSPAQMIEQQLQAAGNGGRLPKE